MLILMFLFKGTMDIIHQELWISGNIPCEPTETDLEPQDGLVKLDAACVWPDLAEIPESCGINKVGSKITYLCILSCYV